MKKNKIKIIGKSLILIFSFSVLILVFLYQIKYITLEGEFTDLTKRLLKEAAQEIIILDEVRYEEIEKLERRKWDLNMYFYKNGRIEIEDSQKTYKERETELTNICIKLEKLGVSERSNEEDFKTIKPELPGYQFPGKFQADLIGHICFKKEFKKNV